MRPEFVLLLALLQITASGSSCITDSDCSSLSVCSGGTCVHKPLVPAAPMEYLGFVLVLLVSILANAGGVGGTSIIICIMLVIFEFTPAEAVSYSQSVVFAGVLTVVLLKFKDRHTDVDRPLFYYDLLLLISAPVLTGVTFGGVFKPAFPDWIIFALLTVILFYLLANVIKKAKELYQIESKAIQKEKKDEKNSEAKKDIQSAFVKIHDNEESEKLNGHGEINKDGREEQAQNNNDIPANQMAPIDETAFNGFYPIEQIKLPQSSSKVVPEQLVIESYQAESNSHEIPSTAQVEKVNPQSPYSEKVAKIRLSESKIVPIRTILYFVLVVGLSLVYYLFKGKKGEKSIIGMSPCTLDWGMLFLFYSAIMIGLSLLVFRFLVKKNEICEKGGYSYARDDIHWSFFKCAHVYAAGIVIGLVTGVLGGGNLMGPFLLSLRIRPEITTVTASFLIVMSTGTATTQNLIAGDVIHEYLFVFFSISVVGSTIGTYGIRKWAIREKRASLLVVCVAVIFAFSLVVIPTLGILGALEEHEAGSLKLGFKSIC